MKCKLVELITARFPFWVTQIDPIKDVKAFLELRRVLKREQPDLLLAIPQKRDGLGRFAAWS